MEAILGFIVLVVLVGAVLGAIGSSASATPAARPAARRVAPAPPRRTPVRQDANEVRRQQAADEAFFDGVVFGHYFFDDARGSGHHGDDPFDPGFDDEFDDFD